MERIIWWKVSHIRAASKDRNEDSMEDTIKIRKDKIKNVAIVFLAVMLVLTFLLP